MIQLTRAQHLAVLATPLVLLGALAHADPALGRYTLQGNRDDGHTFDVRLELKRRPNGKLALERHHKLRNQPAGTARWIHWRSFEVRRVGDSLDAVFTLPAFARRTGATHAIEGRSEQVERRQNRIVAAYRFAPDGTLREVLRNTTRYAPEAAWERAQALGGRPTRLRLGEEATLPPSGKLQLQLPCEGTLHLRGGMLRAPSGALQAAPRAPGQARDELRYVVLAGRFEVHGAPGSRVRAILVQEAQLGAATAPWEGPSYYPVHEFEADGRRNPNTLYREDGPLERFDRAFGLKGLQSAVAWERGLDARPHAWFRFGHYLRRGTVRESHAELDYDMDLDGDGKVGSTAAETIQALDGDGDGRVSEDELDAAADARLRQSLLEVYDFDRDGRIVLGKDVSRRDGLAYDRDRNGVIDRRELEGIVQGRGPLAWQAAVFRTRWRSVLLAGVRRGRELSADQLRAGAWDFMDDADQDGDGRVQEAFNWIVRLLDGSKQVVSSARVREDLGRVFLKRNEGTPEVALPLARVRAVRRGGDGDFADELRCEWWGHCDGVAVASILFEEPTRAIEHRGVTFSPEDLKGLLSEYSLGESTAIPFFWTKPRGEPKSHAEYTQGFHETLRLLRPDRTSFMADFELKPLGGAGEVWNYPLEGYRLELVEAEGDDPLVLAVAGVLRRPGIGGARGIQYRLHFDAAGRIRADAGAKTTWTTEDGRGRLGFIRYLMRAKPVEGHAQSANPFVSAERLRQLFGGRLPYRKAAPPLAD